MSNSSLISYVCLSPNKTSPRNHVIDTIAIHCMAGNLSLEKCGSIFSNPKRQASSNYGIDSYGNIAMYVEEKDRSWCTSSRSVDHRAVSIEVANDVIGGDWHVSDKAYASLLNLVEDICRRNGIKKLVWSTNKNDRINRKNGCNMAVHRDYANKSCPGDYLYNRHGEIADEISRRLGHDSAKPKTELPYMVKINCSELNVRKAAGTNYPVVTTVHKGEIYTIVSETMNGSTKWGKLKSGAGYISLKYTVRA